MIVLADRRPSSRLDRGVGVSRRDVVFFHLHFRRGDDRYAADVTFLGEKGRGWCVMGNPDRC